MFEDISKSDVLKAAKDIDEFGIEKNIFNGNQRFWVVLSDGREYPYKELVRIAHKNSFGVRLRFGSTGGNRKEFQNRFGVTIKEYPEGVNFFSKRELKRFSEISGKPYRKDDEVSIKRRNLFWPSFVRSNKWADLLRERLSGFTVKNNNQWQTGYTFKTYTWHQIYKPKDKDKLVFFTIGIDGGNIKIDKPARLIIKIDCMRERRGKGGVLSKEQIDLFYKFREQFTDNLRMEIGPEKLASLSWTDLVNITYNFITEREHIYEELIEYIHDNEILKAEIPADFGEVVASDSPNHIRSNIRDEPSNSEHNTDWEKEQKRARSKGLNGEKFVEKQYKLNPDVFSLDSPINELKKQMDGIGYDFLAITESGEEYYLEVKSTGGSNESPFFISHNEKKFLEQNSENYRLIRVYKLNSVLKRAEFYILEGNELLSDGTIFKPTDYEVSLLKD